MNEQLRQKALQKGMSGDEIMALEIAEDMIKTGSVNWQTQPESERVAGFLKWYGQQPGVARQAVEHLVENYPR